MMQIMPQMLHFPNSFQRCRGDNKSFRPIGNSPI